MTQVKANSRLYMETPAGPIEVPSWEVNRFAGMTDRQLVDELYSGQYRSLNPHIIAELISRGVLTRGMTKQDVLHRVNELEAQQVKEHQRLYDQSIRDMK